MDPLTAFGLAANVVAFVNIAGKIIQAARDIYESGSGTQSEYLTSSDVVENIRQLSKQLCPARDTLDKTLSSEDRMLKALAIDCEDYASKILSKISSLAVQRDGSSVERAWNSFAAAVKGLWRQQEINELQSTLDRIAAQIHQIKVSQWFTGLYKQLDRMSSIATDLQMNMVRGRDIKNLRQEFQTFSTRLETGYLQEYQFATQLSNAVRLGVQYTFEQKILEALRFPFMDDRFIRLDEAHAKTFSWALESASTAQSGTGAMFAQWLESDSTMFWIHGDPGTGKSTLMKFLANHGLTRRGLEVWAGSAPLVMASFYFFNLGKVAEQKSQQGLLRTLLYQVLRQCPDLIQVAFTAQVHGISQPFTLGSDFDTNENLVPDLLQALERACTASAAEHTRFCFFIDGLDEYEGRDKRNIIRLVHILTTFQHMKVCVSSRLWNEFEEAYGAVGKIRMEKFTASDIRIYVSDTLENSQKFRDLKVAEDGANELVEEILLKARGVFLWVRLVVRSLLSALTDGARIKDLREIVGSLPSELELYFERVLFTVNDDYRQPGARFFQVALEAQRLLPLMAYWYIDQDLDTDTLKAIPVEPSPSVQMQTRLRRMRGRLRACCKGLVQVSFETQTSREEEAHANSILFFWTVDFYHRTVRDFLVTPQMHNTIVKWSGLGFNPDRAICEAILGQIKTTPSDSENFKWNGPIGRLVDVFVHHASMLAQDRNQRSVSTPVNLRTQLKSVLQQHKDKLPGFHVSMGDLLCDRPTKPLVTLNSDTSSASSVTDTGPQVKAEEQPPGFRVSMGDVSCDRSMTPLVTLDPGISYASPVTDAGLQVKAGEQPIARGRRQDRSPLFKLFRRTTRK